jgi:Tol biopolymer transport system component
MIRFFLAVPLIVAGTAAPPEGEIAFMRDGGVWVLNVETGAERKVAEAQYDRPVTWSPDGRHIIWWDHRSGGWDLWRCEADGSNPVNLTPDTEGGCRSPSYSPDGSKIAFMRDEPNGLWLMNADGSDMRRLSEHGHRDVPPQWSPDGTQLLYCELEEVEDESRSVMRIRLFDLETRRDRSMVAGEQPQSVDNERFIFLRNAESGSAIRIAWFGPGNQEVVQGDSPAVSPYRLHLAFVRTVESPGGATHEVRCLDLRTGIDRLVRDNVEGDEVVVQWSPDGGSILVWDARQEDKGLSIIDAATGVENVRIDGTFFLPAWRPAGIEAPES